jgi:hypothetical protein
MGKATLVPMIRFTIQYTSIPISLHHGKKKGQDVKLPSQSLKTGGEVWKGVGTTHVSMFFAPARIGWLRSRVSALRWSYELQNTH